MSTTAEQKHAVAAMKVQLKIAVSDWSMLGVAGLSLRMNCLLFMGL